MQISMHEMLNQRMKEKLQKKEAVDLSNHEKDGDYYILTDFGFLGHLDYCDASKQRWVWSIGRRHSDGKILASLYPDLYENPHFECLWLR